MQTPSRTANKTLFSDFLNILSGTVVNNIVSIAIGITAARIWGADGRGLIAVILIWPTILCRLFYVGGMRSLPHLIGQGILPLERAGRVITTLWLTSSAVMIAITICALTLVLDDNLSWAWLITISLWIALQLLLSLANGVALSAQRASHLRNTALLRTPVALAFILFTGWALGMNQISQTWLYVAGFDAGFFVAGVISVIMVLKYTRLGISLNLRQLMKTAGSVVRFGVGGIVMQLNYYADILLLGLPVFMVPKGDVGNYTVGVAAATMLWHIPRSLGLVMLGKGAASKDPEAFNRQIASTARGSMMIGAPVMLIIYLVAPYAFPLVYGADFDQAGTVVQILSPSILAFFGATIYESGFNARGLNSPIVYIMGPIGILNVLLNIWWIPDHGIYGAAWASAITYPIGALGLGVAYAKTSGISLKDMFTPRVSDLQPLINRLNKLRRKTISGK